MLTTQVFIEKFGGHLTSQARQVDNKNGQLLLVDRVGVCGGGGGDGGRLMILDSRASVAPLLPPPCTAIISHFSLISK
jgi:hypothetical protein